MKSRETIRSTYYLTINLNIKKIFTKLILRFLHRVEITVKLIIIIIGTNHYDTKYIH